MKTLIVPLTTSPHVRRLGPRKYWDIVRRARRTVELYREYSRNGLCQILVLSKVHVAGHLPEADLSVELLEEWGQTKIRIVRECFQTKSQVEYIKDLAAREGWEKVVFVCTWLHYLQVRHLARGMEAEIHGVFGMPYLRESLVNVVWTVGQFILPTRLAKSIENFVEERRAFGKHLS